MNKQFDKIIQQENTKKDSINTDLDDLEHSK